MLKIRILILVLLLFSCGCSGIPRHALVGHLPSKELEPFKKNEKILILAPHPDDEAIACAGIIQKALAAGARVKIVYLTNGDHNELAFIVYEKRLTIRTGEFIHLGKVRQAEATRAMEFLGLSEKDLVFLGYPDYGTFEIFCKYWQPGKPFRDRLTRISKVPYKDNPSYGAEYIGQNILEDLKEQLLDYRPDRIFVSHPADVNVDHKTYYLFLQVALSDLEGIIPRPKVYPYLVHCVGWPKPRHYHPELELYPPEKFTDSGFNWLRSDLSPEELDKKHRAILFYRSQTQTSAFYLLAFARKNEFFGSFPGLRLKVQPASADRDIVYSVSSAMFRELEYPEYPEQPGITAHEGFARYAVTDDYFVVRLDKPRRSRGRFKVLFYVFGYRQGTPFSQMPKIRIFTKGRSCKVFNGKELLPGHGVQVNFDRKYLILKIPLTLLGRPDYVLTALKSYHGSMPEDVTAFRKIEIK